MPFEQFSDEYVNYFADHSADQQFKPEEDVLYVELFERLQWTGSAPSKMDQAVGYSTPDATMEWLRKSFADLA